MDRHGSRPHRHRLHAEVEDRLEQLARDQQRGHQRDADQRADAAAAGHPLDARFDLPLEVPSDAHHLHQQQADEHGRRQRGDPFVKRLIRHLQPEPRSDHRRHHRHPDADVNAPHQRATVGLAQIADDDTHDQEGLEPLPKSHEQSLQHACCDRHYSAPVVAAQW